MPLALKSTEQFYPQYLHRLHTGFTLLSPPSPTFRAEVQVVTRRCTVPSSMTFLGASDGVTNPPLLAVILIQESKAFYTFSLTGSCVPKPLPTCPAHFQFPAVRFSVQASTAHRHTSRAESSPGLEPTVPPNTHPHFQPHLCPSTPHLPHRPQVMSFAPRGLPLIRPPSPFLLLAGGDLL